MKIGERIKALRNEKKMTLEEVAKMIGTSRQTIQRYESGLISNIPSDKIEKLAMAFRTTPAELMGWEIENQSQEEINYISEDRQMVINAISELNAKDFQYVMDLVGRLGNKSQK
jgi:transcriptional regulator with XRE-family HTH domain